MTYCPLCKQPILPTHATHTGGEYPTHLACAQQLQRDEEEEELADQEREYRGRELDERGERSEEDEPQV